MINSSPSNIDNPSEEASILDLLPSALFRLDENFNVVYVNAAAEQLVGLSHTRILGKPLHECISLPHDLLGRFWEVQSSGQAISDRQVSIDTATQNSFIVDCMVMPFRTPDVQNALLVKISILDRSLKIARDGALQTQQEHVMSLMRGLAHEIKNPLGGLRGAAQLLQKQLDDSELHEYTQIIIGESDRLQVLIDRMLGPNSRPKKALLNIHEVLEHVRKITRIGAPQSVSLTFDYDPSIPEFLSDRDRLVQVLLNIAGNAMQAIGSDGEIVFKSRVISNFTIAGIRHPLVASLQIQDNGPGISDDMIDQIFLPLVSGSSTGTGLGLSIAQTIMSQLGGLIECTSKPGDTVFTIFIPLEFL